MTAEWIHVLVPIWGAAILSIMIGMAAYLVWTGFTRGKVQLKTGYLSRATQPFNYWLTLGFYTFVLALLVGVALFVVCVNARGWLSAAG